MTYTSTIREWWGNSCDAIYGQVVIDVLGDPVRISKLIQEGAEAFSQAAFATGYGKSSSVGGYNCRNIGGTSKLSLHAVAGGIAMDCDPRDNPFVRGTVRNYSLCRFTPQQVAAVEAIRTKNGKRVWRWGGDFGDYMHWQIDCHPDDIKTGINWNTVAGDGSSIPSPTPGERPDTMFCKYSDGFNTTDGDAVVKHWQEKLQKLGHDTGGTDGKYGNKTTTAVKAVVVGVDGKEINWFESANIDYAIGLLGAGAGLSKADADKFYAQIKHGHTCN